METNKTVAVLAGLLISPFAAQVAWAKSPAHQEVQEPVQAPSKDWSQLLERAHFSAEYGQLPEALAEARAALSAAEAVGHLAGVEACQELIRSLEVRSGSRSDPDEERRLIEGLCKLSFEAVQGKTGPERKAALSRVANELEPLGPGALAVLDQLAHGVREPIANSFALLDAREATYVIGQMSPVFTEDKLRTLLQVEDPLVRMEVTRNLNRDSQRGLLILAAKDNQEVIRQEACEALASRGDETMVPLMLAALGAGVPSATEFCLEYAPLALLETLGQVEADHWVTRHMLESAWGQNVPREGFRAGDLKVLDELLRWARTESDPIRSCRFLTNIENYLTENWNSKKPGYPAQLARDVLELALSWSERFALWQQESPSQQADEALGRIVQLLGTPETFEALLPRWARDASVSNADFDFLKRGILELGVEHIAEVLRWIAALPDPASLPEGEGDLLRKRAGRLLNELASLPFDQLDRAVLSAELDTVVGSSFEPQVLQAALLRVRTGRLIALNDRLSERKSKLKIGLPGEVLGDAPLLPALKRAEDLRWNQENMSAWVRERLIFLEPARAGERLLGGILENRNDFSLRSRARSILREFSLRYPEEGRELVVQALLQPDCPPEFWSPPLLEELYGEHALAAVRAVLAQSTDPKHIERALLFLNRLGPGDEVIELFVEHYDFIESSGLEDQVLKRVGLALNSAGLPILRRALESPVPSVRRAAMDAAESLRKYRETVEFVESWSGTGSDPVVDELIVRLRGGTQEEVLGAIEAVGALKARRAIPVLLDVMAKEGEPFDAAVLRALAKIGE